MKIPILITAFVLSAACLSLAGCGKAPTTAGESTAPSAGSKAPLPEPNGAVGDIPDTQVFVTFTSAAGKYSIEAPEGWARTENGGYVKFTDHFDGEEVSLSASAAVPTVDSVKRERVPALLASGRAVKIESIKKAVLANGMAVVQIAYGSNSDPDPVTGKQVRLDDLTVLFHRQDRLAALTLWAPAGADNVDQWNRIMNSFRWR
jgi:hypothetical protein